MATCNQRYGSDVLLLRGIGLVQELSNGRRINPNATHTLEKQIQAARDSKMQYAPGDPVPAEGSFTSSPSAVSKSESGSDGVAVGMIIGIVFGVVALIFCAGLCFCWSIHKTLKSAIAKNEEGAVTKPRGEDVRSGHLSMGLYPLQSPHGLYSHPPRGGYASSSLPPYASPWMGGVGLNRPQTGYHQ